MAVSRYRKNNIVITGEAPYANILNRRGVNYISHYSFEKFKVLKVKDIAGIKIEKHIWVPSDRFFKLSSTYYGDPTYWWIIAYYNNKPLETDVSAGDVLRIPVPLEYILAALEY